MMGCWAENLFAFQGFNLLASTSLRISTFKFSAKIRFHIWKRTSQVHVCTEPWLRAPEGAFAHKLHSSHARLNWDNLAGRLPPIIYGTLGRMRGAESQAPTPRLFVISNTELITGLQVSVWIQSSEAGVHMAVCQPRWGIAFGPVWHRARTFLADLSPVPRLASGCSDTGELSSAPPLQGFVSRGW